MNYIEGIDEDFWQIPEYYGRDFAKPKKDAMPSTPGRTNENPESH